MVLGALIAWSDDLTFNWTGYMFLMGNNLTTAVQGIVIKQKLVNKVKPKISMNPSSCLRMYLHAYRISIRMVFYFTIHSVFFFQRLF